MTIAIFLLVLIVAVMLCQSLFIAAGLGCKTRSTYQDSGRTCVLIPYFNEHGSRLIAVLDSLEQQHEVKPLLVVLIDDGSTNQVQRHVQRWLGCKRKHNYLRLHLPKNSGLKSVALEHGIRAVPADIQTLIILDSDTVLHPEAVARGVSTLHNAPGYAAVSGFVVPEAQRSGNSILHHLQYCEYAGACAGTRLLQSWAGKTYCVSGALGFYRMQVFREVGGWEDCLVEDMSWTWRAIAHGHRIGYAPDAIGYTLAPSSIGVLARQRRRWARGRVECIKAAWAVSRLRTLVMLTTQFTWAVGALVPGIAILLVVACSGLWALLLAYLATVAFDLIMSAIHRARTLTEQRYSWLLLVTFPLQRLVFDVLVWPGHVAGIADHLLRRKSAWLTR
ncbi:glycosyltransferase family 2 protein [Pseudomonas putida]